MKVVYYVLVALVLSVAASSNAANYYVATNGNDSASGQSVGNAFASIQKGLDTVSAGDTLHVRGGRYHETVAISNRTDLSIQAYANEQPVIDGTIPINGPWTTTNLNGHSVWVTSSPKDIWQLFVDDRMQVVARWPNVTVGHPCDPVQLKSNGYSPVDGSWWDLGTWGQMSSSWNAGGNLTNNAIVHDLAAENLSFAGGSVILNFHSESQFSRNILTHTAGSNILTHEPVVNPHDKGSGPFLIEHLNALDIPGEWWYDKNTGLVWFWPLNGQDPNSLDIRGKTVDYGLSMTGCSHIRVEGVDFFACTVNAPNQSYFTFNDCRFSYPTWFARVLGVHTYNVVNGESRMQPLGVGTTRLTDGSNHTIKNCIFEYSDALIDLDQGFQNVVENNLFHHFSFSGMASFMLNMNSNHESIQKRNTFHTNGSKVMSKHSNCDVSYSRAYWFGYFQADGTAWQCKGGNGAGGGSDGVRRDHCWHHDALKSGGRWDGSTGINGTNDHFVSWNATASLMVKGDYHSTHNNTAIFAHDPTDNQIKVLNSTGNTNSYTYNNLTDSLSGSSSGFLPLVGYETNNWNGYDHPDPADTADEQLRDPGNLDFRPTVMSDLIDQGSVVPGITDGYMGSAPDIGAYEFGCTNYWIPGYQSVEASIPIPPDGTTTAKTDADLMWLAGREATSHSIYFGTNSSSLVFMTNQVNNIFDPGLLADGQTYYWRIDEVTPTGTVVGTEWSFTPGTKNPTAFKSFYPVADTYAHYDVNNATYASQNFGTDGAVRFASYTDGSVQKHGYMKFDVAVTGAVVSAELKLHNPNGGTVGGLGIYAMTNTLWGEYTLTWNNRPTIDGTLLDSKDIKTGWSSFYVGDAVSSTGLVSFGLIKGLGNGNRSIDSRDATAVSNRPVLIVEYEVALPALPAAPSNLTAIGQAGQVSLSWDASAEPYVIGYNIYRSVYLDDGYDLVNSSLVTGTSYIDTAVTPGQTNYYKIRAFDQYDRLSAGTPHVIAVPLEGTNTPPAFSSDSVVGSNATVGVSYSGTIANNASDADGDALTFSKVSGSSWLIVATNGVLSGTPAIEGLNIFSVQVSDGNGGFDTATLNITVEPAPVAGGGLAYEGFAYVVSNKIHGLNGGTGFSSAWVSSQDGLTNPNFEIVSPGDSWGSLPVSSNRLLRTSTGGTESLSRTLSADLDATNLWFSVLWRPRSNEGFAIGSGALLENGGPPDTITGGAGFGFMNTDNTMAYASIYHSGGRTDSASGLAISQGSPVLLAGFIEFNVGPSGEDRLSLYPVTTNLTLGTPVTVVVAVDETTLNTLTMESNRGPGYDEIRLGRTFADVISDATTPALSPYASWWADYGLTGSDTNYTAHTDTDGMNQLMEYGLGGNPTNDDAGAVRPIANMVDIGGTNWMEYIYRRRTDAAARGLGYWLELNTNLVSDTWTSNGYVEVDTGQLETGFESVTNRISTDAETNRFIRLRISID